MRALQITKVVNYSFLMPTAAIPSGYRVCEIEGERQHSMNLLRAHSRQMSEPIRQRAAVVK